MAKRGSSKQRLQKLIAWYCDNIAPGRGVTTDEMADWAIKNGLYPTPGIRNTAAECELWDRKWADFQQKHAIVKT